MDYNEEEIQVDDQQQDSPDQNPPGTKEPDYIDRVHSALKDNLEGFNKTPEEFRKLVTSDDSYRKKVYTALKENLEGFNKTEDDFSTNLGVKKKDAGQSASSITKILPGQTLPASGSGGKNISTAEELLKSFKSPDEQHAEAVNHAITNLNSIDLTKTKEGILKTDLAAARMSKVQSFVQQNGIDNTANTKLAQRIQQVVPNNLPVQLDEDQVNSIKKNVNDDQRFALKKYAEANPDKANQVKKDIFLMDQKDNANKERVLETAKKIESGDYEYNIWKGGRVLKPQNFVDSFLNGWHERTKELDDYEEFANLDKLGSIKKLEEERQNFDPLEPVSVPKNRAAEFTEMFGSNAIPMIKGAGVSVLATAAASPEAAPWLAAAINTPEYGARAHVASLRATYNQLREQGMSESDAFDKANTQATIDAAAAAAQGAIQTYAGVKIGGAAQPFKFTPSVKGVISSALNTTKEFAKHSIPNAAIVGGLEVGKNIGAKINGIDRDLMQNVAESAGGQLFFEAGLGLITKGAHIAGKALPKYKQEQVKQNISQAPQEQVDAALANLVTDGTITPEAATETRNSIIEHRDADAAIPEKIVNPEVRLKIQKLIERRIEHEDRLKSIDKAYHEGIKDKIATINEEIDGLSNSPEAKVIPQDQGEDVTGKSEEIPAEDKGDTPATGKSETGAAATEPAPTPSQDVTDTTVGDIPQKPELQVKEQPLETKNHKVEYENGKRVAYDKTGNVVPEYVKVEREDGKISTVKNKKWANIMRKHEEAYNYNFGEKAPEPTQQFKDEKESADHFIASSKNPSEIAEAYASIPKEPEPLNTQEYAIAHHGIANVKTSSFDEVDDRNNRNISIAKSYLVGNDNPKGVTLDQIAHEISSDDGVQVTPEDVANFMKRFPNGQDVLKPKETDLHHTAKERFENLTGIPLNDRTAALAIEQLHAAEVPKAVKSVETDIEAMPDEEALKWLRDSEKSHNFEGDDETDTIHTPVQSSGNEQAENRSVSENQGATRTGNNTSENVHPRPEQEPGKSVKDDETGTTQSDEPDGNFSEVNKLHPPDEEQSKNKKFYEEIQGAKPFVGMGRIPVDPIIGGEPKRLSQISKDLATNTEQKLFNMKPGRRSSIGAYLPGSGGIKIKYTGDLDTTAHEIGHSLDDQFKILTNLPQQAKFELAPFIKFGSTPPKGHPNAAAYRLAEGFAEWLRAYVVNPKKAIGAAPETYKAFTSLVPENYRSGITTFSDDVRTFAGASGRDMTLANLQWKPEEKKNPTMLDDLLSIRDPKKMFKVSWADKVAANFINPMRVFEKSFNYAKGLKGIDDVLPQDDPVILARLLLSVDRKFGEFMENGFHDANDQPVLDAAGNKKTFGWLLEPLDNTDQASIEKDAKTTAAYMLAERTVELSEKFGRSNVLSGIGGGIFKDIDVAKKTLNEITNGDPEVYKRVQEAADRYRSMSDDMLKYMVDKGRLSQEQYDLIKDNNLYYVAMNRIMETEPGQEIQVVGKSSGALGSKQEIVKSIKGSTREIQNPYLSLLDNVHKSIKESDRNAVLQAYTDMIAGRRGMHQGDVEKLSEIGIKGMAGDKETVPVFKNGKVEHWKFEPSVYAALKNLDNDGYKLPGILTLHARLLRGMTTRFPTFAARNWIRDFQDRVIKSNDGSGVKDLFGDKKHWEDVARNGGLNSGYYMKSATHYYGLMEEAMKGLSKEKKTIFADPTQIKKLWHGYENILEKGETSNRVAEYRAGMREAKKQGMDDYNASLYGAFKSRDLMDFAVMGHWMRIVNQIIPFSNAAVQGLRSSAVRIKENPGGFLGRTAAYTVLPQAALWMMTHRNKEDAEEYENLPAYQRDMFWNVKIGPNNWLSIPKPYELGMLASGVDRGLSKAFGYNKEAFDGYAGSVVKVLTPIDEAAITGPFQPEIEAMTNHDFFRDKSIIPDHENGLDLSLRHTERGSRLGQALQDVAGIDSRKIDHIIRSQFSYVGNFALKLSDVGTDNTKDKFDLPDLGTFKKSPAYNAPHVQELMHYAQQWGLQSNKDYKEFKDYVGEYFEAKTNIEKDAAAKVLTEFSKNLIHEWKALKIGENKKEAAETKKAEAKNK